MLNDTFRDIIKEIKSGYLERNHPFKYCYLSSVFEGKPKTRTVVLREITDSYRLVFFTDKRSPKIKHFTQNPYSEALFYHPNKLWQIKFGGKIHIIKNQKRINFFQQKIHDASIKNYTTRQRPSSHLISPKHLEYSENLNFAVLELSPDYIENLQLKRTDHLRTIYRECENWKGSFLVP